MKLKRSIDSMAHSRSRKGGRMRLNYQFLSFPCLLHIPPRITPCICVSVFLYIYFLFPVSVYTIRSCHFVQTSKLFSFVVECIFIINSFHPTESFKLGYYPPKQSEDLARSTFECSRVDGSFRNCILYFCICLHLNAAKHM